MLLLASALASAAAIPALAPIDARTSLLVIAPHPDDETLCCAGIIGRVLAAGGRASIVWLTSGDGSELDLLIIEKRLFPTPEKMRDLGERRSREARAAAELLGVRADARFFLGYPDRGLLSLLTDHLHTPFRAFSGASAVPYSFALSPGAPFTGDSLERDLARVIERVGPTLILAATPQDTHPDHQASGLLARRLLGRAPAGAQIRYWIVHGGRGWPAPRGLHAELPMDPAPRARALQPQPILLDPDEEARKLAAVRVHETQMEVMSSFLLSFVRRTELFSAAAMPPGDPGQP